MATMQGRLERRLSHRIGMDVRVVFTDNARSMLSFKQRVPGIFELRVHRMFREANGEVVDALAEYLRQSGRGPASRKVDQFIRENLHLVRGAGEPPTVMIRPRGTFFNLREIFDRLNREYFGGALRANITWATPRRTRRRQTTIRLGTYWDFPETPLIRVHPVLDHSAVPIHVIERIVFHEMLHQVFGLKPGNLHPPEFRRAERRYRHYRAAKNWENRNLEWLLGKHQLAFHIPTE